MKRQFFRTIFLGVFFGLIVVSCKFRNTQNEKVITPDSTKTTEAIVETEIKEPVMEKVEEKKVEEKKEEVKTEKVEVKTVVKKMPLTIVVDNLESPTAPVEMSIYDTSNKFPEENGQLKKYRFKPKNGKLVAKIKDQNYGEFALALYQDVNSSGKIDKNFVGIPKEPYAFSNNYKPTVKAPSFKDCKFTYSAEENTLTISLLH